MAAPKVLSNSIIYTGVTVLQRCISFFLLPLYTTYLTPADYGITGVVASISGLLAIFTTLGLTSACSRFYYKYKGDPVYVKKLYGSVCSSILITSLFFCGLFIIAHKWIVDPLVGKIDFYPYVLLGILNVLVMPLYTIFQGYLQTIQDGKRYGINAMLYFLLQVALTIFMVTVLRWGALGVLTANLVTAVVFFVYVLFAFYRHQQVGLDKGVLKDSYKYSLPLLPHTLANWSNGTIDKLLVNGIRSESDAGLYNLGRQYTTVTETISVAMNNAYVPWFFDKANDVKHNLPQIRRMSEMITYAFCFISIVMSLFAQEVLDIMISNPAYDGVWRVIPLIISGLIFNSIYFFYVNVLFLKHTGVIFTITVSTIAINVALNIWLIPIFGYMGCGIAVLVTYFMKSVLSVAISMRKNHEIRFRTLYLYLIGSVSTAICLSAYLLTEINVILSLSIKGIIVTIGAISIYYHFKEEIRPILLGLIKKK